MHRWPFSISIAILLASCTGDGGGTDAPGARSPAVTVPDSCASSASFAEARRRAEDKLGALPGDDFTPARSTHVDAVTVGSVLGRSDLYTTETAILVRQGSDIAGTFALPGIDFPVDFTKEALLVVSYWPSESSLTVRREGATLHVFVARAKACVDEAATKRIEHDTMDVLVGAIPLDITKVELHTAEEPYMPLLPRTDDACTRDGVVFSGGGRAGVLRGSPSVLFVEGFSQMTGNVFAARSTDDRSWTPAGWSAEAVLSFDGRGPFADVYRPSPIEIAGRQFLYARVLPFGDFAPPASIARFAHVDGVRYEAAERVLSPAASGWDAGDVTAPALVERSGIIYMYYAGSPVGSKQTQIGLATSADGGKSFARRGAAPIVSPALFPYPVSAIEDPEVRVVDGRLEMWCTVWLSGGNPQARLSGAVGHLTSEDGETWTADDTPLVIARGEAERVGIVAPTVIVSGEGVTLLATAINGRSEPVVERLTCPRR